MGNPVIWMSGNCYLRPENLLAAPDDPFRNLLMSLCSFRIGKRAARGDLFEHLRKPPPVP